MPGNIEIEINNKILNLLMQNKAMNFEKFCNAMPEYMNVDSISAWIHIAWQINLLIKEGSVEAWLDSKKLNQKEFEIELFQYNEKCTDRDAINQFNSIRFYVSPDYAISNFHSKKIKIFISYAREDSENAKKLYHRINNENTDIWFDEYSLLPGQKWKAEIKKAIKESDLFITLLSVNSTTKRGLFKRKCK